MSTITNKAAVSDSERISPATIDSVGWGLFFIWVGIAIAIDVGWGIALIGIGVISLGAQFARILSRSQADGWSVAIGACFLAAGLALWLDISLDRSAGQASLPSWFVPGALVLLGVVIVVSAWARRRKR